MITRDEVVKKISMDAELVILSIIGEGIRETVKWYQALLVLQLSQNLVQASPE